MRIVDFRGGLYAAARCEGAGSIGQTWQELVAWREDSKYRGGSHQWLEEHIGPVDVPQDEGTMVLDLYLPIVE